MNNKQVIDFYVDGATSGNKVDNPESSMGVGIIGKCGDLIREWSVSLGPGTNSRAELHAVRIALEKVRDRKNTHVHVTSDSAYVIGLLTKQWKASKNAELVEEVRALVKECASFRMSYVKGHAGHPENERADELAVLARQRPQDY